MRPLILSAPTGQGHNAVSKALQAQLTSRQVDSEIKDIFTFLSPAVSSLMEKGHNTLYRHFPGISGASYSYAEKHDSTFSPHSPLYRFLTAGADKLYQYAVQGGFDCVIATHVFAALIWTRVKQRYAPPIISAFVATDYTCSPSLSESDLDAYFIPDATLAKAFIRDGIPPEKLHPLGLPVQPSFQQRMDKAKAKAALGIPANTTHLLMMCGSMGCGPMEELTRELACQLTSRQQLTVLCGTNEKLHTRLTEAMRSHANVCVLSYTEEVSALMDSADLYLTKPGGISVTEAACKGLPMVLIDAVAGCEEYNRQFFVQQGGAVTADSTEELLRLCLQLLNDPARLSLMSEALLHHSHPTAAQDIITHLQNTLSTQKENQA